MTSSEVQRQVLKEDIERFRKAATASWRLGGKTMATTFEDWGIMLQARLRILDYQEKQMEDEKR